MEYLRADKVATMLNISLRSTQLKCKKKNLKKDREGYLIPEDVVKIWLLESPPKVNETKAPTKRKRKERKQKDNFVVQEFTEAEFEYLDKLIKTDYPVLLERSKQQDRQIRSLEDNLKLANHRLETLLNSLGESNKTIQQRNTLDLIDKTKPKE